nr:hypothetical protein [Burkholderia gladioli]
MTGVMERAVLQHLARMRIERGFEPALAIHQLAHRLGLARRGHRQRGRAVAQDRGDPLRAAPVARRITGHRDHAGQQAAEEGAQVIGAGLVEQHGARARFGTFGDRRGDAARRLIHFGVRGIT